MLLMNDTTRAQEQFLRIKKPILCMIGIEKKKKKHQNNNQTSLSHVEQRERDPLDLATLAYRQ